MDDLRLLGFSVSPNPKKKFRAFFSNGKHTDFGDSSMEDYTQHHDRRRRELYRHRHAKDLKTHDPTRAGYLSYYILWGDSRDIDRNITKYKDIFGL
jgi:hypothetical protein